MGRPAAIAGLALFTTMLAPAPPATAQGFGGQTVQGDAALGQARFFRGMAWYELGTAQADALNADAAIAWSRSVRADYERYLLDKATRQANKRARRDELEQDARARLDATRRRWRENPTVDDIRSGDALNALAGDLADPSIPPSAWQSARVELPAGLTLEALAFRFANAPRVRVPGRPGPGVVALGRMKVGERWAVGLRRPELDADRAAYVKAVADVIDTCTRGKALRAAQVDAVRESLAAIREQAAVLAPGGRLPQSTKRFLHQLDEATRLFLDRDVAEELVRDVSAHRAKTVGELLGFMKKYRLVFAEGDENPEVWAAYQALYDLLKRQAADIDFARRDGPNEKLEAPARPR
jgi:hypothetical protein